MTYNPRCDKDYIRNRLVCLEYNSIQIDITYYVREYIDHRTHFQYYTQPVKRSKCLHLTAFLPAQYSIIDFK